MVLFRILYTTAATQQKGVLVERFVLLFITFLLLSCSPAPRPGDLLEPRKPLHFDLVDGGACLLQLESRIQLYSDDSEKPYLLALVFEGGYRPRFTPYGEKYRNCEIGDRLRLPKEVLGYFDIAHG